MLKQYTLYLIVFAFFLLIACSSYKENPEVVKIKHFINNSCPLNKKVNTQKDITLASIYFNTEKTNLTNKDKEVLNQVIAVSKSCGNKLMIIGNASNYEHNHNQTDINSSYKLAYLRAKNIFLYLNKEIYANQLYYLFCDNLKNRYEENNQAAIKGNQRVDVVMLSGNFLNHYVDCLN